MGKNFERRAERLAETLRRAGESEEEVQRRVRRAVERMRIRTAKRDPAVSRFAGCVSVTRTAQMLGMARADLFARMEQAGWLYRTTDGWRPTDEALSTGWAVLRGRGSVQWVQLTPAGMQEIVRFIDGGNGEPSNE